MARKGKPKARQYDAHTLWDAYVAVQDEIQTAREAQAAIDAELEV